MVRGSRFTEIVSFRIAEIALCPEDGFHGTDSTLFLKFKASVRAEAKTETGHRLAHTNITKRAGRKSISRKSSSPR